MAQSLVFVTGKNNNKENHFAPQCTQESQSQAPTATTHKHPQHINIISPIYTRALDLLQSGFVNPAWIINHHLDPGERVNRAIDGSMALTSYLARQNNRTWTLCTVGIRMQRLSGIEQWNGIVEWNSGMTFYRNIIIMEIISVKSQRSCLIAVPRVVTLYSLSHQPK